jgi:hypothetical protein
MKIPLVANLFFGLLLSAMFEGLTISSQQDSKDVALHTWEHVGSINQISGKFLSIRRTLRISDSSWSLEPGAISEVTQLGQGDQIMAKGKTTSDGTFDTTRIYMLSASANHNQGGSNSVGRAADHGGPESRVPTGTRYPGDTGIDGRGRTGPYPGGSPAPPSAPGGGGQSSPGTLQSGRGSAAPRFLPGDLEGEIAEVHPDHLIVLQTFVVDKDTHLQAGRNRVSTKDLQVGQRVAVTIKDEVESKARARKATVIRLLP